ncbi:MAG TPA: hypothetical protein VN040_24330 [Pseudosphingobacterium sp.]|nr:hypothetical protein [Pseudosphingobacterium sp.]
MAILKKIGIVYFFIWLMIPKDALLFIASFPAHYSHHLKDHGKISLAAFFQEHIAGSENHQSEEREHEQKFPCDHHHTENCSYSLHNIKILPVNDNWAMFPYQKVDYIVPFSVHFPNEPLFAIWQPPKTLRHPLQG